MAENPGLTAHYITSDVDPYKLDADPGRTKLAKIMEKFYTKNQQKPKNLIHFCLQNIDLCLKDINIYPINNKTDHLLDKYIFNRKNSKKKWVFSRIGSGSIAKWNWFVKLKKIVMPPKIYLSCFVCMILIYVRKTKVKFLFWKYDAGDFGRFKC